MSPRRRLLLPLLAAVALAGAVPVAALADDGAARGNVAAAFVQRDGGEAFDFAWSLVHQRGGTVDHLNAAGAVARCTDCRAAAIAFQIVLVSGTPSQLAPVNRAVAVNDQCVRCTVYAGARQFVRVTDRPVKVTAAGHATLADVRRRLRALAGGGLGVAELGAAVEAQEARVLDVLATELVPADGAAAGHRGGDDNQADDDGSGD